MSELSLERTSQDPRMQKQSPFLGAWKGLYHAGQSQQKVCIQCLVTCPFAQAQGRLLKKLEDFVPTPWWRDAEVDMS
jgi:hypothetical protein